MNGTIRASWFPAQTSPMAARKQWIAGSLKPRGTITIDDGAARALARGKSLLAAGVIAITGQFEKGDAVSILSQDQNILGQGLAGYSADDCREIMGINSAQIVDKLGYDGGNALIHRDNMALLA